MATFIKFLSPGALFMNESVVHCPAGVPASEFARDNLPPIAYGYRIGKRGESDVEPKWFDGTVFVKGEVVSAEEAVSRAKAEGNMFAADVLAANCEFNGYKRVVILPGGQHVPFHDSDTRL